MSLSTKTIGNCDVDSFKPGAKYIPDYTLDGFMVGRGVFKNQRMFNQQELEIEMWFSS